MINISKGNTPSNLKANTPEDGKYIFIRNAGAYVLDYFAMTNSSKGNIPSNLKVRFPEDEKYNFIGNTRA
jgi:phosphomevalonate kinase